MQEFLVHITETIGTYIPNLLAALLVLVVGWLIALIISAITRSVIKKTSARAKLSSWISDDKAAEGVNVEQYISKGVFYLLMIFVLAVFFQTPGLTIVTEPLNNLLNETFAYASHLPGAVALLLAAWLIAIALRLILTKTLTAVKPDDRLGNKTGKEEAEWSLTGWKMCSVNKNSPASLNY